MSRVRVFIACSLDGFIAGPDNDLSWLPEPSEELSDEHGFAGFISQMGAMLMGRNTYDVVMGFDGPWPYGELPVLVATNRELESKPGTVQPASGRIFELIRKAESLAGEKDIYLDGGNLIRQALDAELVDEMTVSIIPIILGHGVPLFSGAARRQKLNFRHSKTLNDGMVQLTYRIDD